ncbi:chitobiase/beta-hexosaminidase C-terminal domain-containing protein [Candidatus Giovannonibacteria bacterium]|nr:chitobiase/beta-hexosaminidase C-terminal domain-containing protein [Candidatus Giovannonibacteria bacterium]
MRVILEGDQLRLPFLTRGRIQEIAVNSPAMYELLPSPTYFEKLSGYIKPFSFIFDKKLYNYDETRSHITKEGGNNNVFGQAETFFDKNLANIDLSGIDAYNISGCKTATPISYKLALMGGIGKINYGPGDGTVPIGSGDYLNIPESNKYYVAGTEHAELPSAKDVRGAILNILYGRSATTTKNFSKDFSTCGIKGKLLSWHSPVDVSVYDSEGNHSGPLENNFEFGIPGVNYIISGHNKFIFLPTDENRQYRIEGQGTDKGTFDLLISEYDDSQVIKTDVFNDVRVSTSTLVQFNISATSTDDSILVNDENIFEISELTGDQGEDVAPPQTSIKINDSSEIKNWYKDAEVSLESIDDDSGIFETRYSTDGENFSTYSSPFHISGEGTTTIKYYSIDKAGNNEEIKTASFYIDNTPPEFKTFFDLNTKSIVFLAFDNLDASPDISCAEILCAAIDKAGNETILNFKQKNYLGDFSLNLSSIIYNGITNNFIENEFEVDIEKKSGVIKNFRQEFSWDERNRIKIEYKKSKDESLIKEYAEKGRDKTTKVPGIKFLQVITNKGKILTVINEYFLYGYICSPGSFTILNLTPILGSLFSLFLNFKQKKSIFWYLINGIVFILISLNILTLLSISNMKLL